jgi:L-aminopeptidase/D-esterase-like protein
MTESTGSITDVPGILVGHADDPQALTGCTVILCMDGAVGGVDQRGGSPGTRETDLLRPLHRVERVHAVLLAGGSAYGLDAAGGVMRFLEQAGVGFDVRVAKVPIVPAAILFDLDLGSADVRPDAAMGYAACQAATDQPPAEGNVGAGMGASVGKILGPGAATKAGLGTAYIDLGRGVRVGAIVAVNALGDVIDPSDGSILAGTRSTRIGPLKVGRGGQFANTLELMKQAPGRLALRLAGRGNTVIGVVATNASLDKNEANYVAQMAQDGIARTIRPAHTAYDGDTIFALSTGSKKMDASTVGAYAAEVLAQAIVRAVNQADAAGGLPCAADLAQGQSLTRAMD